MKGAHTGGKQMGSHMRPSVKKPSISRINRLLDKKDKRDKNVTHKDIGKAESS